MNYIERLKKQLMFSCIIDYVQNNQKKVSKTGRNYFMEAIAYLNDARAGLEKIAKGGEFPEQEKLKEIYDAIAGKKKVSKESVSDVSKKLEDVCGYLKKIIDNPEENYKDKNREEILDICGKIKDVYDKFPNNLCKKDWEDIERKYKELLNNTKAEGDWHTGGIKFSNLQFC